MTIQKTTFRIFKQVTIIIILLLKTGTGIGQDITVNNPPIGLPKAFSHLSDSLQTDITKLTSLFSKKNGDKITLHLGNETLLEGFLHAVTTNYNNTLTSVSLKLTCPDDLVFTFSKIVVGPNTIIYRGLVIGRNTGDYLELVQDKTGFKFIKKEINYLRAE